MPNHCANSAKFTATTPEAAAMLDKIRASIKADKPEIFQTIHPCPQDLIDTTEGYPKDQREAENIKKHGFANWYEFQTQEWGTKWDAYDVDTLHDEGDTLTLNFDTAWSPPLELYRKAESLGFEIEATYCEAGCDFVGFYREGEENTDSLSRVAPPPDDEGEYLEDRFSLPDYFRAHGIDHAPAHFGG